MQFLTDLKNRVCSKLNDQGQINQINDAYNRCYYNNKEILKFASFLLEYSNNDNKGLHENIERNTTFNTNKIKIENFNNALNYFNCFHFIKYKHYKQIPAHYEWINNIIPLNDGRFATSSNDRTIKIWDPNNDLNFDIVILGYPQDKNGHQNKIWFIIQLDNGYIVSMSNESDIRIWSISKTSYQCLFKIDKIWNWLSDSYRYQLVALSDNRFIFNDSSTLRIWSTEEPFSSNPIKEMEQFCHMIFYVKNKDILIVEHRNKDYKFYSMKTYQLICTIIDSNCKNYYMYQIDEERVIGNNIHDNVGKGVLTMINVGTCLKEKSKTISALCLEILSDNILLLVYEGFGVYNLKTNECSWINTDCFIDKALKINESTVITINYKENDFKVWQF